MHYTHDQITDLIQHAIAVGIGYGCTVAEAEQIHQTWQQAI